MVNHTIYINNEYIAPIKVEQCSMNDALYDMEE